MLDFISNGNNNMHKFTIIAVRFALGTLRTNPKCKTFWLYKKYPNYIYTAQLMDILENENLYNLACNIKLGGLCKLYN